MYKLKGSWSRRIIKKRFAGRRHIFLVPLIHMCTVQHVSVRNGYCETLSMEMYTNKKLFLHFSVRIKKRSKRGLGKGAGKGEEPLRSTLDNNTKALLARKIVS